VNTAIGAAAKIFATIDRVPSIDSASSEGLKPSHVTGSITLDNVYFTYPSRPDVPILKGISMSFKPGTTSALVGASGCGKSTIVALIERFYDPVLFSHNPDDEKGDDHPNETRGVDAAKSIKSGEESLTIRTPIPTAGTAEGAGSIKIDGLDLRELNLRWLRSRIGFVQQEPILFATNIWKNVAYGLIGTALEAADEAETMRLVKEACIKANADEFVSKLPDGTPEVVNIGQVCDNADLVLLGVINRSRLRDSGRRARVFALRRTET
jgi:ATP-binding cassette subfamily B (MDR/TAP) protein 1